MRSSNFTITNRFLFSVLSSRGALVCCEDSSFRFIAKLLYGYGPLVNDTSAPGAQTSRQQRDGPMRIPWSCGVSSASPRRHKREVVNGSSDAVLAPSDELSLRIVMALGSDPFLQFHDEKTLLLRRLPLVGFIKLWRSIFL
jgi:hypothetical protein